MYGISKTQVEQQTESVLLNTQSIYFVAAVISLCLSYFATLRAAVINPDAICYVQSAVAMKMGLSTAMHLCGQAKWPFFSSLIYGVASTTHLSYVNSAFLLDSLFSLISVLTFISIVRFINDSARLLGLAAFVILFSHEFNSVREYIIRDHGFWAFYLVSVLCLLRYFKNNQMRYALGWSASILVATLFRVEGCIFLMMLPGLVFLKKCPLKQKVYSFFQLNTVTFLFAVLIGVGFLLHHHASPVHSFGRLEEIQFQFMHGISQIVERFNTNTRILGDQILSQYASHDAKQVLVLLLIVWFVASVINNVSILYAGLILYAWTKKCLIATRSTHLVLWGYLAINVLITFTFLIENMFLSKRYLLALSLTLMIWLPFALNKLCEQWPKRRVTVTTLCVFIVIFSLGGIFDFGYSKTYIRDAGRWLEQHVPANATLYSNDEQLLYYSQHFGNDLFVKSKEFSKQNIIAGGAWNHYDYIAIRLNKKDLSGNNPELQVLGQPIQEFANKRGDKVNIYRIH